MARVFGVPQTRRRRAYPNHELHPHVLVQPCAWADNAPTPVVPRHREREIGFTRYSRGYITMGMRATTALVCMVLILQSARALAAEADGEITVSAAISLKEALIDAAAIYV